jgi:SP family arabinose:H+ symporter-like MFS transporter
MATIPASDNAQVFGYGEKDEATDCSTAAGSEVSCQIDPPRGGLAAKAVTLAVISSILFGYQTIVLNSCADLIAAQLQWCGNAWQSDCQTSSVYIGLTNASLYLGAACGAWMVGRPQVFARGGRLQLVISDVLFALGGLCCACAMSAAMLIVGRVVSGMGLGMSAIAAPMYIAEVSPRECRGANSALVGVGITSGILLATAIGLPQGPPPTGPSEALQGLDAWYWRFLLGFPILPALLQAALFLKLLPIDPPSFLVRCGRFAEARSLLYKTYGLEPGSWEGLPLETQLDELRESTEIAKSTPHIKFHEAVLDPFLQLAVFLGVGLAIFQQLCGINALMSYSNDLFQQAGIPASDTSYAALAMNIANVCASVLSAKLVDNWGRRALLLYGSMTQALAMGALYICVTFSSSLPPIILGAITVLAFTLFVTSFSAGLGAITWLYLSEIYPMEIRGSALSMCGILNWLSSFVVVFSVKFINLPQMCFLFCGISAVGSLMVFLWVVETKGCSMEDSPLTPRSGRSTSRIFTPTGTGSPAGEFVKMEDEDDDDEVEIADESKFIIRVQ